MRGNSQVIIEVLDKPMTLQQIYRTMIQREGWALPLYTILHILYNLRRIGFVQKTGRFWKPS